jgi:hypothetical protein
MVIVGIEIVGMVPPNMSSILASPDKVGVLKGHNCYALCSVWLISALFLMAEFTTFKFERRLTAFDDILCR